MDRLPENFTVGRDDVADTAVFQQQALSEVDINSNWKLNILMQNAYFQEKSLKVLRVRNLEGIVNDSFTEIGIMRNLELLWINYTSLSVIPESICLLTNLQELNLSTNKIEAITTSVGDLTDLQELVLSFNNIKQIPPSIGNLANLQKLILLENQIINIPSSIGNLKYLELLSLPYNQIKSIPSTIGNLINLERLYLNSNRLEHVPASIGNLTNLKRLVLSQNKITEIPSSIGEMKNLKYLDFSENKLKSIPECIGNLHQLENLNLYDNLITVLPETLCNLSSKVQLTLDYNPLQKPPNEVCKYGIEAIKGYFEDIKKSEGTIYSKRLKIILVGESGAGKTSLANALVYGNVENVGPDESTIGLDYHNWVIPEEELKIQIVDCAGQREYLLTHQFFFTEVDLSKYNKTGSVYKTMVGDWVTIVTSKIPGASILVVPTHLDCCRKEKIDVYSRCQHLIGKLKRKEKKHVEFLKEEMDKEKRNMKLLNEKIVSLKEESEQFKKMEHLLNKRPNFSTLQFTSEEEYENAEFREEEISLIPICTKGDLQGLQLLRQEIVRLTQNKVLCPTVSHLAQKEWQCLEENMVKIRKSGIQYISIQSLKEKCKWELPDDMLHRALVYFNAVGSIQFFHNVEQGRHLVFIDPNWFVDLLKLLFRHDHENTLMYKKVFANEFGVLYSPFKSQKQMFLDDGHLSEGLLKCIWLPFYEKKVGFPFVNVVEILAKLGLLCKLENETLSEGELYFIPWFVPEEEPENAREEWQLDEQDSTAKIIATRLETGAAHLPASMVCRFLVSVQSKAKICLPWKKGFLVINRELNVKLHCDITHEKYCSTVTLYGRYAERSLREVWKLMEDTLKKLDDLINEWNGFFLFEKYSLCPFCVQKKSSNPTHFRLTKKSDDLKEMSCRPCKKPVDCSLICIPKEDLSRENENKTQKIGVAQNQEPLPERKIKDLRYNEVDEIAKLLDPEMPVVYNWKELANHCGFNATEKDAFARSYCGGGNPALHFFMKLKTRCSKENESIRFLIECCREIERIDVVRFIETQLNNNRIPENATIHDLPHSVEKELAAMLTEKPQMTIKCWKNLACLYGFQNAEISQIDSSIKVPNSFSPTKALFQAIQTSSNGEEPISFLIGILVKMDRNDVVKLIQTFN